MIHYVEIPAPDVKRAAAFYRTVFGWTVTLSDLTADAYGMFSSGGDTPLSGGFDSRLPVSSTPGILLYISVPDIDATLEAIAANGGKTIAPKTAIGGGYGFSARFADPNGNVLGLISS